MSTAAAWDTLPVHTPASRPRLVVIDGGAGRADAADRRPAVLAVPRWVRLAVTLSVVAVLVTTLLGVGGAGAATAPLGSVEVRSGQTLSQIAVAEMPGVPVAEAVAQIQLANNLPSTHVTAGQVIVIPAS
ncbi:MAG: LysM peptidoglycan-binding domain-containing protein [Dermatophilaceae bacterium]|nr:LysM peptidoglycan-binding domain-containing protein [Intrasporangiaceae bacterium]